MSDNLLGGYLRARREAVTPAEVGLPNGDRRRTPGLRRSELATVAGVSVEYLTRLEQGRDRRPSLQVLAALADALRLSVDQRRHLLHLNKQASGNGFCTIDQPPTYAVRPTVRALLARLEPTPALVVNRLADVLAVTTGYRWLTAGAGLLDARPQPANLVRFVFTDARARTAYPEWDRVADHLVASLQPRLRSADPHLTALVEELTVTAGAPFTSRITAPALVAVSAGVERLKHPDAGELRLAYESLELSDADDQRLIVYLPADAATSAALDRLTAPGPGFRASDRSRQP